MAEDNLHQYRPQTYSVASNQLPRDTIRATNARSGVAYVIPTLGKAEAGGSL